MISLDEIERLARDVIEADPIARQKGYPPAPTKPHLNVYDVFRVALNPAAVLELVERVKEAERRGMEKAAEFAERRAQDLDGDGSYRGGEVSRLARDLRAESAMKRAGEG